MAGQSSVAPIVFVHGGAHGAWCWEPLFPFLDGDALAVDLPPKSARGGSRRLEPVPELRTLTIGDFADSVLGDIDGAGFERFVLVGHSMGGLTISEVAHRVPDRVEHLVYVSCMVPPDGASAIEALPEDLPT
jgi:pimeloyl-ACP methyl ester carboxylesterase